MVVGLPVQVRDVGSGAFGVCKLMKNLGTGQLVAVKQIERGEKVSNRAPPPPLPHIRTPCAPPTTSLWISAAGTCSCVRRLLQRYVCSRAAPPGRDQPPAVREIAHTQRAPPHHQCPVLTAVLAPPGGKAGPRLTWQLQGGPPQEEERVWANRDRC